MSRRLWALLIFLAVPLHASAAEVQLSCRGTRIEKHYSETHDVTFLALVDLEKTQVILKTPQTIFVQDNAKTLKGVGEIRKTVLRITKNEDGFLFLEKEGPVSDSDMVFKLDKNMFGSEKAVEVKVRPDDNATGLLDSHSGRLTLETRFYKTHGPDYEYGWSIAADCKNDQKLF